ncbi:MAG: hypothetical protein IT536_12740 [Hyphomicrobiales bacterium]|nr:hypothetical protein [Hyphomicrobiales bacterium]
MRLLTAALALARPWSAAAIAEEPGPSADADRSACHDVEGPRAEALAACTRLIASRTLAGRELAIIHLWRGVHRSLAANRRAALQDFNAALRLDPTLAAAYLHRAALYESQGDRKRALADYHVVRSLDPDDRHAADAVERIEAQLLPVPPGAPD